MDPRNQRPLLSPFAVNADKADELMTGHREEAKRAASAGRADAPGDARRFGRLGRLLSRLRARVRR
jgi:hypothetical protein